MRVAVYNLRALTPAVAALLSTDALAYRLQNAGAKALITNAQGTAKLAEIRRGHSDSLAGLQTVLSTDGPGDGAMGFHEAMSRASSDFSAVPTAADDPAMMIYT